MLPRLFFKFRSVLLGIVMGFGFACAFVLWTNQCRYLNDMPKVAYNSDEWHFGPYTFPKILTATFEHVLAWLYPSNFGWGVYSAWRFIKRFSMFSSYLRWRFYFSLVWALFPFLLCERSHHGTIVPIWRGPSSIKRSKLLWDEVFI